MINRGFVLYGMEMTPISNFLHLGQNLALLSCSCFLFLSLIIQRRPRFFRGSVDFTLKMVTTLMDQGSAGLAEEEKKEFILRVIEKVKA